MKISGNKTISISKQSSMIAHADVFLDSLESPFSMLLSGSSICGLYVSGSRIYNLDGEFVFAPDTDYNFDLSIYVDESGGLCSINNIPVDYKSGDFSEIDYIVLDGNAEVELNILGKTPSLDFSKISDLTLSTPLTINVNNLTPQREFLFYDIAVNETNISNLQVINKPASGSSSNNFDIEFSCDSGVLMESGFVDFSVKGNFGLKNFRQNFFCNTYDIEYIFDTNYSGGSLFSISSGNFIDIYADFLSLQSSDFEIVMNNDGFTDITENWRLYSGDAGGGLTNLYDTNQYESGFFSGSMQTKPSFMYSLITRVEYLGGLPSGEVELNLRLGSENIAMTFTAND